MFREISLDTISIGKVGPEAVQNEKTQVKTQVTILTFCSIPRSKAEIAAYCGYKNTKSFTKNHLRPLLESGLLKMTIPDKPSSRKQRYITVSKE